MQPVKWRRQCHVRAILEVLATIDYRYSFSHDVIIHPGVEITKLAGTYNLFYSAPLLAQDPPEVECTCPPTCPSDREGSEDLKALHTHWTE